MNEEERQRFVKNFSGRLEDIQHSALGFSCLKCCRSGKCSAGEPIFHFMEALASHFGIAADMVRNKRPGHVLKFPENTRSFSKRVVVMTISTAFGSYMADYVTERPYNLAETITGVLLSLLDREGVDWRKVKESLDDMNQYPLLGELP